MESEKLKLWRPLEWTYLLTIAQVSSALVFTFLTHNTFFLITNDLSRPTPNRIEYVIRWSQISQLLINGMFGIFGYLLLAQHSDVFPIPSLIISAIPTTPIAIGKLLLTLALFFKLPLHIFNTKEFIYEAFGF